MRTISIWVSALCAVVLGCSPAEPDGCGELVWLDPGSSAPASNPFTLELGRVFACVERSHVIQLRNFGSCAVDLESFETDPVEGLDLKVVAESHRIEPGKGVAVRVSSRPGITEGEVDATIIVRGSRGESATLTLSMEPLQADYALPTGDIEFGPVLVGDSIEHWFTLNNPTAEPATYSVGTPQSGAHPGAFSLGPDSPSGEFELGPDESRQVVVRFQPSEQGAHLGTMTFKLPPCGVDVNLRLNGEGVDQVFGWDPQMTNFGCVPPGLEARRSISFANLQARPVRLSQIKLLNGSEFQIVSPADGTLEIPAATRNGNGDWVPGTATIEVSFTPVQLGLRQTQLTFQTNHPNQATGFITLKGGGCGGPDISVTPSEVLDFSIVSGPRTETITVMNVGTAPSVADPSANLLLGVDDGTGSWGAPYIEVVPASAATAVDEFSVTMPSSYDPAVGLEATSGKHQVQLLVTFAPNSNGLKEAELRLFSNDPDQPVTTVMLRGEAALAP